VSELNGAQQAFEMLKTAGHEFERPLPELIADLKNFEVLLRKWQKVQNLVSRETLDEFWLRHIADSLQLANYIPDSANNIVDFGSGGGFPAIPLAIVLKRSEMEFILIESNSRKVAFLRAVARELGLKLRVKDIRIEDFVSDAGFKPDIITARALAPLTELLRYSYPLCGSKTRFLFQKGREHVEELAKADGGWDYNVVVNKSVTDGSGVVLEISDLRPRATE